MTLPDKRYSFWLYLFVYTAFPIVLPSYVNYAPGYEYIYNINSNIELKGVNAFVAKGQLGFVNIAEDDKIQELRLIVHGLTFTPEGHLEAEHHHHDFSKWFSFEVTNKGEIGKVYHAADEDSEILMLKKGFAGMLSAKLHQRHEVEHEMYEQGSWGYKTDEFGREGRHNASYVVRKTSKGYEYIKTRNSTLIQSVNGNGTYIKLLNFHKDLNTIHSIMIEEELFIDFSTKEGFDPFHGMRPVHAVSGFIDMGLPQIAASSKDRLVFLKTTEYSLKSEKPNNMHTGSIHHTDKIKKQAAYQTESEVNDAQHYISGNMTCIRQQPEKGSPELGKCFHNLVMTLEQMNDDDVEKIATNYFLSSSRLNRENRNIMVDAFVALNEQNTLVNKVLNNLHTDEILLKRVLTLLTTLPYEPDMELLTTVERFCFKGRRSENVQLSKEIRHVSCLTFGGLIDSVRKYGQEQYASKLVQYLHNELGIHDPWLYKMKRSAMTEIECIEHDHNKVILLDAIGNAGLSVSYEYIVSHINSTNSQWIKRTGVHALRFFHDLKTLQELEKVALYDEDNTVRYEALLQYQAHPFAAVEQSEDNTGLANDGISKRSILDAALAFRLEAPGVDWRKQVGSSSIGASFGVVMENLLDLHMCMSMAYL